jgi:hypothetical protein
MSERDLFLFLQTKKKGSQPPARRRIGRHHRSPSGTFHVTLAADGSLASVARIRSPACCCRFLPALFGPGQPVLVTRAARHVVVAFPALDHEVLLTLLHTTKKMPFVFDRSS